MAKYILRLDDASEKRNILMWDRVEALLDKYEIKPLVGVIPCCEDPKMDKYEIDRLFWNRVSIWQKKGWEIALHGYNHVYTTKEGGINPIQRRSEFAGVPLEVQKKKIKDGVRVMEGHGINTKVFFAPSHTFDLNTIKALREKSKIRIISDTISSKPYKKYGITFVPQQLGRAIRLPLGVVTICYHPNLVTSRDLDKLERFLKKNGNKFVSFPCEFTNRQENLYDKFVRKVYYLIKYSAVLVRYLKSRAM